MTRFELAASTSLRWRSSQTEPHPDICITQRHVLVYTYMGKMSIKKLRKVTKKVTVQPCPFISCRFVQSDNLFRQLPTTYFMLGVRPIKMNIQNALCEQAPNSILYIQFCMAELLQLIKENLWKVLTIVRQFAILFIDS